MQETEHDSMFRTAKQLQLHLYIVSIGTTIW